MNFYNISVILTMGDSMNDFVIEKIENVFYFEDTNWHRNFNGIRHFSGIVLFTDGEIEYCIGENTITAQKGDLMFFPWNVPYSGKKLTNKVAFFVLDFHEDKSYNGDFFKAFRIVKPVNFENLISKFKTILSHWEKKEIDSDFIIKAFAYKTLCEFLKTETTQKSVTPTDEIIDFISENLSDTQLNVEYICNYFFISESQLRRNIFKTTGYNPNGYILTLRLNRAKNELIYTDKPIQEIAFDCGFSSPYYFSRCFTENFKISPREYRKLYK